MYSAHYDRPAQVWLEKNAKKNPNLVVKIVKKIDWLAENVDHIDHEKMIGHQEMSLHFSGYRILYRLDRLQQKLTICFIDKHDEAYRKLNRKK